MNEPISQKGFEIAEVSLLNSDQYDAYLKSVLSYNEAQATIDTAFMDGERKKAMEIATRMLAKGLDVATISEMTLLSIEEIERLR